jgi:hypothetical protein
MVLALLKGRRVSLNTAWRALSPKSSLITSGVRTYYAMICMSVSKRGKRLRVWHHANQHSGHSMEWGKDQQGKNTKAKKDHDKLSKIFPYGFNANISKGSH